VSNATPIQWVPAMFAGKPARKPRRTAADPVVNVGMTTPWGRADYTRVLAPGIGTVGTPGHGGIKLDRAHNARVPEYMRREGGWYEEDCEWSIPFCVFAAELTEAAAADIASGDADRAKSAEYTLRALGDAVKTLRNWYPDEYERFTGRQLQPGESMVRDERDWKAANADKWQVISASHSKHVAGHVVVEAAVGGRRQTPPYDWGDTKRFLVPADEYAARGRFGFVVDPARHPETTEPD